MHLDGDDMTVMCLLASYLPLQEPWIIGLLAAQALLFLSVIVMRNNSAYLSVVFGFGGAFYHRIGVARQVASAASYHPYCSGLSLKPYLS